MARFLWICLAGAVGTGLRYGISVWAGRAFGTAFPWGTFIVNVVGCFLIAAITHVALSTSAMSPTTKLTLTTGLMGGLTTYSSFNLETTTLFRERAWASGALNVGLTMGLCFVAGLLGLVVARRFVGP